MMKIKMGRPSKYNNVETKNNMQELVYLFKKEEPSGIIRIADMVRFSKKMNDVNPDKYTAYNKDVWSEYGRSFIEVANEPIRTKIEGSDDATYELPNIADIIQKHSKNEGKLLEFLLPIERLLHELILEKHEKKKISDTKDNQAEKSKEEIRQLKENIKYYEQFILTMSHDSYRKEFEGTLKNQISVNANERNKKAVQEVDNLEQFFDSHIKKELPVGEKNATSNALEHWRKIRKS